MVTFDKIDIRNDGTIFQFGRSQIYRVSYDFHFLVLLWLRNTKRAINLLNEVSQNAKMIDTSPVYKIPSSGNLPKNGTHLLLIIRSCFQNHTKSINDEECFLRRSTLLYFTRLKNTLCLKTTKKYKLTPTPSIKKCESNTPS